MIPVNQVILGGSVIGNSLDEQLQLLERYKQNLEAAKQMKQQVQQPMPQQPIPLTFKTSFIGDIEVGGGSIKLNIPLTDKRLVFDMTDLENFKEMLITKD